jgi:hypothetical protein
MFIFEAIPGLAETGIRGAGPAKEPLSYQPAVEGLLIRNLGIIRREFPHMFLLTTDVPYDAPAKTHARFVAGLYDKPFMDRFPHEILHFGLGSHYDPDKGFRAGPEVYSRLFDIGRDDITFLWDGLLNKVIHFVHYHMLYSSGQIPLSDLKERIEGCRTRKEFDDAAFDLIDIIAYVFMTPHLYLFAKSDRVNAEIQEAFDSPPQHRESLPSQDEEWGRGPRP